MGHLPAEGYYRARQGHVCKCYLSVYSTIILQDALPRRPLRWDVFSTLTFRTQLSSLSTHHQDLSASHAPFAPQVSFTDFDRLDWKGSSPEAGSTSRSVLISLWAQQTGLLNRHLSSNQILPPRMAPYLSAEKRLLGGPPTRVICSRVRLF